MLSMIPEMALEMPSAFARTDFFDRGSVICEAVRVVNMDGIPAKDAMQSKPTEAARPRDPCSH